MTIQKYPLMQIVIVNGETKHPEHVHRVKLVDTPCIIVGARTWKSKTLVPIDVVEYQVQPINDNSEDPRCYWVNQGDIDSPTPANTKPETSEQKPHMFVNRANGQWFYGHIIHKTEKNLLVDKCGGQNEEVLVCKADYKIYLEQSL